MANIRTIHTAWKNQKTPEEWRLRLILLIDMKDVIGDCNKYSGLITTKNNHQNIWKCYREKTEQRAKVEIRNEVHKMSLLFAFADIENAFDKVLRLKIWKAVNKKM